MDVNEKKTIINVFSCNKTEQNCPKMKNVTKNLDSFENVLIVLDCPDKLKRR